MHFDGHSVAAAPAVLHGCWQWGNLLWHILILTPRPQIQSDLGEGHVNIIEAKEVMLTEQHLVLSMEYAACGSLTGYVAERWQDAQRTGLFLGENEARYFFRVSGCPGHWPEWLASSCGCSGAQAVVIDSSACTPCQCACILLMGLAACSNSWMPCPTATITTWLTGASLLVAAAASRGCVLQCAACWAAL